MYTIIYVCFASLIEDHPLPVRFNFGSSTATAARQDKIRYREISLADDPSVHNHDPKGKWTSNNVHLLCFLVSKIPKSYLRDPKPLIPSISTTVPATNLIDIKPRDGRHKTAELKI